MKIVNEASRLFFAMLALILVAMLTTPSSLTTADATLVARSSHKSKSSIAKKEHHPRKFSKSLADLF